MSGQISSGAIVLSPGRSDLADGSWVKASKPANQALPRRSTHCRTRKRVLWLIAKALLRIGQIQQLPQAAPIDPNDATISAAITSHIDSVVNEARKNLYKFSRTP